MSPDGRFVVFSSFANNLTTNDYNYYLDVFLRDREYSTTTLISVTPDGSSGNAYSGSPSMSTNGAWIAFESDASDLVPGDTNQTTDVFVRNTTLGLTALVSVNTNGSSANGTSTYPLITPDGRFVAFESMATDLVTNTILTRTQYGREGAISIYLRDLSSNTTVLASVSTNGTSGGDGDSKLAAVSSDGRYVLFTSTANMFDSPSISGVNVYLRDTQTQQTILVSTNVSHYPTEGCFDPVMSADAQAIAFGVSIAPVSLVMRYDLAANSNLTISSHSIAWYNKTDAYPKQSISDDGGTIASLDFTRNAVSSVTRTNQIYVWDSWSETNNIVTVAPDGSTPGNADSFCPVLSANGAMLVFLSLATNLDVNTPVGFNARMFIRNLDSGITRVLSVETNQNKQPGDVLSPPIVNTDGSLIAFGSTSDGLVDNDNNGEEDVFISKTQTGATELTSTRLSTVESKTASGSSYMPSKGISSDGRFIAFSTFADNLLAGDTNRQRDVYIRDIATGKTTLASVNMDGTGAGNDASYQPSISDDGNLVVFQSRASDLASGDTNGTSDVFIRDMATGQTRLVSAKYDGTGSASGTSDSPAITPDGHYVIYRSNARNIISSFGSDPSCKAFAYEVATGSNYVLIFNGKPITNPTLLAISPDSRYAALYGSVGNLATAFIINDLTTRVGETTVNVTGTLSGPTSFSSDGRWLSFETDSGPAYFLNLYDQVAKTNKIVGVGKWILKTSLNADGTRVAYDRIGTPPLPANVRQIFVYDATSGSNILVSANLAGDNGGNANSRNAIISPDGRYVYFNSRATDLVADTDNNGSTDVFVRDLTTGTTRLLSVNRFNTGSGNNLSVIKALSADGQVVAMESFASDLIASDFNMAKDVFVLRVNESVADSDNDGLPDSWEIQYFGNLDRDGTGDFDNDGMSDAAEFLAGTNPTDMNSVLMVIQLGEATDTGRIISWLAVPGKTYKVQYKTNLNAAAWADLPGTVTADVEATSITDDTTNGSEQRFYRVVLVP